MNRLVPLIVVSLLITASIAQEQLDPEVEQWLSRIERALTESQQRLLAERLVVIRVPMYDLLEDYQANEITADEIYKGHQVEFAGKIAEVGVEISRVIERGLYMILEAPYRLHPLTVRCGFVRSKRDELATLQQGQTVTVQGELRFKRESIIQINNCSLIGL